jgi:hypothetical protein
MRFKRTLVTASHYFTEWSHPGLPNDVSLAGFLHRNVRPRIF